jgi:hypothetical protein
MDPAGTPAVIMVMAMGAGRTHRPAKEVYIHFLI